MILLTVCCVIQQHLRRGGGGGEISGMLKSEVSVSDHYLATSDRVENFLYLKGIMKGLISTGGGMHI